MADEIQAQAEPAKPSTVAEPVPATPNLEQAPLPTAASSDPNPSPASVDLDKIDFDKVDGGTYAQLRESMLNQEPPAQAAAVEQPAPPQPAAAAPPAPAAPAAPTDEQKHSERIRIGSLPARSQEMLLAATALAKAEGIEIDEAFDRIKSKAAPAAPAVAQPELLKRSPAEIDAQIATLKAEKKDAANNADTLRMYEIDEEVEALRTEQAGVRAEIANRQQSEQAKFDADVAGAKAQAIAHYPAAADKNSPLGLKIAEIAERLGRLDDPLMRNPNAPFKVTQMAAAELGIAPVDPNAPPKVSPSTLPATTSPSRPMQPAPGALRSAPPAAATGQLEERLASVNTLEDYESLKEQAFAGAR